MERRQSSRDTVLRSRMRSQVRDGRKYSTRSNYQRVKQFAVGQEIGGASSRTKSPAVQAAPETPKLVPSPRLATGPRQQPQSASQLAAERPRPAGSTYQRRPSLQPTARRQQAFTPSQLYSSQFTPQSKPRPSRFSLRNLKWSPANMLTGMAVFVFLAGLFAAYNGWMTNKQIEAQAATVSQRAETDDAAPSTVRPTKDAVRNYVVAPDKPRFITIERLSVHARIKPMSVNAKNQLQAPTNVYDAGWYDASAKPGEPGAMLIDGHISSWQTKGVFYGLNTLKSADKIQVTRGDGKIFNYSVVDVDIVPVEQVNMASMLVSSDKTKPGLNLISCYGEVVPGTNDFDKRVIVRTVQE